eukprot:g1549.t1
MEEHLSNHCIDKFKRWSAMDGVKLSSTTKKTALWRELSSFVSLDTKNPIQHLNFHGNGTKKISDFSKDQRSLQFWGTIACQASHLQLWENLSLQPEGLYLILEDDAVLSPGWACRLHAALIGGYIKNDWHIIQLFASSIEKIPPWRGKCVNEYFIKYENRKDTGQNLSMIAYIVRGGNIMKEMIKVVKEQQVLHIDVALNLSLHRLNIYLLRPRIIQNENKEFVISFFAGGRSGTKNSERLSVGIQ